ncbi:MAG: GNAT family N-acetyltransferase [Burkholderiaceae bacterium]
MSFNVRPACLEDAAPAAATVRDSITQLCVEDHCSDPDVLAKWLANKTPSYFERWIGAADQTFLVADNGAGAILGVADLSAESELLLLYVSPSARGSGVSTALLSAVEQIAARQGMKRVWLHATKTAQPFYLKRGYVKLRSFTSRFGTADPWEMEKLLGVP